MTARGYRASRTAAGSLDQPPGPSGPAVWVAGRPFAPARVSPPVARWITHQVPPGRPLLSLSRSSSARARPLRCRSPRRCRLQFGSTAPGTSTTPRRCTGGSSRSRRATPTRSSSWASFLTSAVGATAAIELISKAIARDPGQPGWYSNLGNVLVELGRLPEAADAYRKAIALEPRHADAYNNLGAVLRAQGRLDESAAAYLTAIELAPGHLDAHNNLGNLLSSRGRVREAIAYYCKAITLMPGHPEARKLLGIAYCMIGQVDAASEVYRNWLADEPDNPVARHLFAACSGREVPDRASDAYVETTFDAFAGSFDAKLQHLAYRAPQLIASALERASREPAEAPGRAGCRVRDRPLRTADRRPRCAADGGRSLFGHARQG